MGCEGLGSHSNGKKHKMHTDQKQILFKVKSSNDKTEQFIRTDKI